MLINDQELTAHYYIILIALEELLRAHCIIEVADHRSVLGDIEIADPEDLFNLCHALFSDGEIALLLIDLVMHVTSKFFSDICKLYVPLCWLISWTRDDERGTGFIDQDRVNFVDDREVVFALYAIID